MASPTPLRPEEVPNQLKCSICFGVPLNPRLLPCEHVFCSNCIERALSSQSACPNCRRACSRNEIRDLQRGTLSYRIWSNLIVKCSKHNEGCSWTGSVVDFQQHLDKCVGADKANQLELEMLKKKVSDLEMKNASVQAMSHKATVALTQMQSKMKNMELLPKLFDGNYNFKRGDVVQLSKLISRYLTNKPDWVDSNRIYQCISECYKDMANNYTDNPQYYSMDMHMLLTTCIASATWFTSRQLGNLRTWVREYSW